MDRISTSYKTKNDFSATWAICLPMNDRCTVRKSCLLQRADEGVGIAT